MACGRLIPRALRHPAYSRHRKFCMVTITRLLQDDWLPREEASLPRSFIALTTNPTSCLYRQWCSLAILHTLLMPRHIWCHFDMSHKSRQYICNGETHRRAVLIDKESLPCRCHIERTPTRVSVQAACQRKEVCPSKKTSWRRFCRYSAVF